MLDVRAVDRDTLEPVLFLLQSHDVEVQRAASAALGNLAVNSKFSVVCSKPYLRRRNDRSTKQDVRLTMIPILSFFFFVHSAIFFWLRLITAENKLLIVKLGGLEPLIRQMLSPNVEVQCNAVGCITNLATHGMNPLSLFPIALLFHRTRSSV